MSSSGLIVVNSRSKPSAHILRKILFLLMLASSLTARAALRIWTNTMGGDWSGYTNWSPNAVPAATDSAYITNAGTYSVYITNSSGATISTLTVGGTTGTQTLIQGSATVLTVTNSAIIASGGVLADTNAGLVGPSFTVQSGGTLQFSGSMIKYLYNLNLLNQGTVTWGGCTIEFGTTGVLNTGLWQMTGNDSLYLGGGNATFTNYGTFRKASGTGQSFISGITFVNEPGALIDGLSGLLEFSTGGTCTLGGTINATIPGTLDINGTWTEAGAVATGTGTNEFGGGTLNLVSNNIPGLVLVSGTIVITGTTTFQHAGSITNLQIDGATFTGTNTVGPGTLTLDSGYFNGQITVLSSGQLVFATSGSKYLYMTTIINQGLVDWYNGPLGMGTTVISNGALWVMTNDNSTSWGGYNLPIWTNAGTLRKSTGTGVSSFTGMDFTNVLGGTVEADSGTISLPINTTNTAGNLLLEGGTITASSVLELTGGTLEGTGSVGLFASTGGVISPGIGGPGEITFNSGLSLAAGSTLSIDGIGTTPGTQYDQLSVTGAVTLGNATLQVTSLPSVPVGTTFIIIANDGTDPVSGTFNGLAENTLFSAGGQPFRIHYAGGTGNDVTLVRDSGPQLTNGLLSSENFTFSGAAVPLGTYTIQATTNFINWANIGTNTADAFGHISFMDTNASQFNARFYRTTN